MGITLEDLRKLDPQRFELLVGALMQECGFQNVLAFGGTGDEGIDLRAEWMEALPTGKHRHTVWAVQCKRYKDAISDKAVRDVLNAMIEPPQDLLPRHPDFFLIATTSKLSVNGHRVLNRANANPEKYGCHFVVWEGERLVDLVNSHERMVDKFFQARTEQGGSSYDVTRLQIVCDQFESDSVLVFTFEGRQCLLGRTQVSTDRLQRLASRFQALPLWTPTGPTSVADELLRHGAELFQLIPAEIQDALRQSKGPLRITSNIHILPFELALDAISSEFLGSTHQIGRIHFGDTIQQTPKMGITSVIFVAPPSDLANVESSTVLFNEPGLLSVTSLEGTDATAGAVSRALAETDAPIIVHYAGHAVVNQEDRVGLLLADGLVNAGDLLRRAPPASLLFVNTCSTGQAFDRLSRASVTRHGSIVVGFVGPVTDRGGALIAEEFYRQVLSGVRLGEAVQAARELQSNSMPGDYSWASFVLFGDPVAYFATR